MERSGAAYVDAIVPHTVREMHDVYMLVALLLVLAIVLRVSGQRASGGTSGKKRGGDRSRGGVHVTGVLAGLILGLVLAQVPRIIRGKLGPQGPEVLVKQNGTREEPLPCKQVRPGVPYGAEGLPPGIIVPTTDMHLRRLWGKPDEDLPSKPIYLLALLVKLNMMKNVDKIVSKFTKEWMVMLFHEEGKMDDWLEFTWAARAAHVVAARQTKWWFAKRFLHPDVVAPFDFVFVWDQNLDVDNFDPTRFIKLMREHELEIAQPAVEPEAGEQVTWQMTKRLAGSDFHKYTEEKPGWCKDPRKPPCAGFVEIQAPVFSRTAWRCVWNMIQNDLVHGWGLDFNLGRCAQPAHEKIGVVDVEFVRKLPSPHKQAAEGEVDESVMWQEIQDRCHHEWDLFKERIAAADEAVREQQPKPQPKIIVSS